MTNNETWLNFFQWDLQTLLKTALEDFRSENTGPCAVSGFTGFIQSDSFCQFCCKCREDPRWNNRGMEFSWTTSTNLPPCRRAPISTAMINTKKAATYFKAILPQHLMAKHKTRASPRLPTNKPRYFRNSWRSWWTPHAAWPKIGSTQRQEWPQTDVSPRPATRIAQRTNKSQSIRDSYSLSLLNKQQMALGNILHGSGNYSRANLIWKKPNQTKSHFLNSCGNIEHMSN
mmetsp:Transcript_22779/g.52401  ORF Transcript_22779/g.52401 Transcript_22779/m.52401 type:complete len:230 (+) Transcript_22779:413-1102(+)